MFFLTLFLFLGLSCGSFISQYILEKDKSQELQSSQSGCHDSATQFQTEDQSADSSNDTIGTSVNKGSKDYDRKAKQFSGYLPDNGLFYWCVHHRISHRFPSYSSTMRLKYFPSGCSSAKTSQKRTLSFYGCKADRAHPQCMAL